MNPFSSKILRRQDSDSPKQMYTIYVYVHIYNRCISGKKLYLRYYKVPRELQNFRVHFFPCQEDRAMASRLRNMK